MPRPASERVWSIRTVPRGEEGIAMVTVIMMATVLFATVVLFGVRSVSNLDQSTEARARERSLHVSESGVDDLLARLVTNQSYNTNTGGALNDLSATCMSTYPSFASNSVERSCVKGIADSVDASRLVEAAGGQWVSLKPSTNVLVVYAVGYVPTRANPTAVRVVRARYEFAPLAPQTALLTDGDLDFGGNAAIQGLVGSAHANGNVTIGGSSFAASGFVASSGGTSFPTSGITDTANSGPGKPPREVPAIVPRQNYVMSEYDLCVVGGAKQARAGPSHPTSPNLGADATAKSGDEVPCAGTLVQTVGGLTPEFNGWDYQANAWRYNSGTAFDGVYYVYQDSVKITGSPGTSAQNWRATIFTDCGATEATEAASHSTHGDCDIEVNGSPNVQAHTKGYPLLFVAGRDLDLRGNPSSASSFSGAMAAHEQFSLGGNATYTGVIISNSDFDTSGSPVPSNSVQGNPTITFDGNLELPFGKTVRINHWQEL